MAIFSNWDINIPTKEYFKELFRISKNQIIWGGNYFSLPPNKCFLIWDKIQPEGISFAMCEYAWASFDKVSQIFRKRTQGQELRFHPTQKPIALYEWIYHNYLPQGGKVIDTHAGSQSNTIAALKAGNIEIDAIELDKEYYDKSVQRVKDFAAQLTMF